MVTLFGTSSVRLDRLKRGKTTDVQKAYPGLLSANRVHFCFIAHFTYIARVSDEAHVIYLGV